jgi:Fe-S cluster biogenesis protein NfuA
MFIQTEETPNPNTLKFIPGKQLLNTEGETFVFSKTDAKISSQLAKNLLNVDGVDSVFYGKDFVGITKNDASDWYLLKPYILGLIMEHFVNGLPLFIDGVNEKLTNAVNNKDIETDNPIIAQIIELIDTRVRPAVAQDGGDIVFDSFTDGIVYLKMVGACSGCPSSHATLKSGIENMLKFYIPEIEEVRAVENA